MKYLVRVYKLLQRIQQPLPETPGQTPFFLAISVTGFFYVRYTTHGTYGFTSNLKDEAIMVKCLAEGHKCQQRDSNPDSTDQKHQSLMSLVCLTSRPQHANAAIRIGQIWACTISLTKRRPHFAVFATI